MNSIIRQIINYIPNEKIKFRKSDEGLTELYFINHHSMMTILYENTWDEIKRIIDSKIKQTNNEDCLICFSSIKNRSISCNKCSNRWCIKCYADIFKANKGLVVCPFCRYTIGTIMNSFQVEIRYNNILRDYKSISP